jgi:hypothetical protein
VPYLEEAGYEVVMPELPIEYPEAGIERYVATVEAALEAPPSHRWWWARRSAG